MKNDSIINRWRSDDEDQYVVGRSTAKSQKLITPSNGRNPLSTQVETIRRLFGNGATTDCALDEQKHDPKNGQFAPGGGSGGSSNATAKASKRSKAGSPESEADLVSSGNLRAMGGRRGSEAPKKEGPRRGKGGLIHLSEVKGANVEEKLKNMDPADRKKWERHLAKSEKAENKSAGEVKPRHETVSEIVKKHKAAEATAKPKSAKTNTNAELVASGNLKAMGGRKPKATPEAGTSSRPDFSTLATSLSGKKSMKKKDWAALTSSYR
jgi:hypothetical protein